MAFARQAFVGLIRALRRAGSVGIFCIGLVIGAGAIGLLNSTDKITHPQTDRFAAPRAEASPAPGSGLVNSEQPWSRVLGGQQFEKVTDVAILGDHDIAFAGLSLGVGEAGEANAILVRTGAEGYVHGQVRLQDERLGSVSRVQLDDEGRARIIHWVNAQPAFAMADLSGNLIWTRVFEGAAAASWAEIATAENGATLIALIEAPSVETGNGRAFIMRLDAEGKIAWRHELDLPHRVESVRLAGSGDGGALVAVQVGGETLQSALALLRLDRRGRLAWQRPVASGTGLSLADTSLRPDGALMLVAGSPSSLFRLDGLGELTWARDLPALDSDARHVVQENDDGDIFIIAEPRTANGTRRHWLARYTSDGRQVWAQTRVNRLNATLETVAMAQDGQLLAGGSLIASSRGDTDMLMMQIGSDGGFPQGLHGVAGDWDLPEEHETAPSAPILAASLVLDEAAQFDLTNMGSLPGESVSQEALETMPGAVAAFAGPASEEVREVSAPLSLTAIAPSRGEGLGDIEAAPVTPMDPPMLEESALADPVATLLEPDSAAADGLVAVATNPPARPLEDIAPESLSGNLAENELPRAAEDATAESAAPVEDEAISEIEPVSYAPQMPTPRNGDAAYAYQCTFTCLAQSDDVVKYPVSRLFANVSESNGALVSLDMMAMDRGVCLETGGRVFDQPRLPPVCERVN